MTARTQRHLALLGGAAVIGLVLAANAHLVIVALGSQPACAAVEGAAVPAKPSC